MSGPSPTPPTEPPPARATLHDRPSAAELVAAVRELLERDVMPATEGRIAFHARVATNVLAMVERELAVGPELDAEEHARLVARLGHDGTIAELTSELAAGIRAGAFDDRRAEVVEDLRATVRAKLAVANPTYAEPHP
jgi:hypothetical protein